jgi:hypothetical protein
MKKNILLHQTFRDIILRRTVIVNVSIINTQNSKWLESYYEMEWIRWGHYILEV